MAEGAERAEPGDSEQDEEEDVYEVERIIDMRVEDGEILYRVRWKNYSSDDDTWEPKAHLEDCTEVLLAYERVLAERKSPKKDPGMLPMKSDLFNANSESDSDKERPRESPVKKKKKKKHIEEDSEDEKSVKDKKKKKKKEKWKEDKPLPAPESDEEEDKVSTPPSPKKEKTTDVKKRVIESDDEDDDDDDGPSAAKKHKKDKLKDGGKQKKEVEERKKKKVKSRKELESSEDETDKSDVPSESHTDDTTATDNLSSTPVKTVSPKSTERSSGVDHSKAKQKNKKTELKLQSFKDLVQEKKPKKSERPAPVLKESGLSKLKSLTSSKSSSKSSRSEEDPDSGDTAATAKPKSKGKSQESNLTHQKDSLSSSSTTSSAVASSNKSREDETREEAGEKGGTPNNLFEKFLLTCEAKDRVPRKPAPHTTPKNSGKTDKKVKPTKESPVQSEKAKEDRLNVMLRPKRQCTAKKMLDFLCNIDEMESEGEQCEVADDERDDESDSSFEPHSGSDSECEIRSAVESSQEARDGTVWVEQSAGEPWVGAWNVEFGVLRETPGPTKYAMDKITSPLSSLMCLIDEEMWEMIQKHTQAEIDRSDTDGFKLTAAELKAFVALTYMRGITGGKTMKLDDYWSSDLGNPIFLKTLTRQRFRDIMRHLRFDDKNTRAARHETDKFAMISELFYKFVQNSIASYVPGENITVGEQLFPTKARCRFAQYVLNKDKFGLKFWVAADADTKYVLNIFPYLGKDEGKLSGQRVKDSVVTRLVEPFLDKGRNITTSGFFPSLALASHLLVNKTTVVGTIRKSKQETPQCTQTQSEIFNTKVLRTGNTTLTIYQAKPKENVCVLSTMHQTVSVDNSEQKLPNSISHYYNTKFTVDVLDRMAHLYTVKNGTRRWPVAVFYNILDLAAINAHILYKRCTKAKISRRKFIIELVKELCKVQQIAKAGWGLRVLPEVLTLPVKRKQCQIGKCSKNKTFNMCEKCRRFVCGKCSKWTPKLCFDC
uniref:Chromo domain-containing protein n=1 Tax=Astyanax mexicanus TaxID=7994 RepID=A0A3B1KIL6_ASTMX